MIGFVDAVEGREAEAPFWVSPRGTTTASALRQWLVGARRLLSASGVERCGVRHPDPAGFAACLMACDGWVDRMVLVPSTLDADAVEDFSRKAGFGALVGVSNCPSIPEIRLPDWGGAAVAGGSPGEGPVFRCATEWVLATSGTTATPKLVSYPFEALCRRVKRDSGKGATLRWGLLYDVSRFAGLQVLLQAAFGGSCLVFTDPEAPLGDRVAGLARRGCNALSATPTLWRNLLMLEESTALDLSVVTLGGEMADQKILDALACRFPGARITHIYASTEAGVGFSIQDQRAGFPASFLDQPPEGIALRVDGEGGLHLRVPTTQHYLLGGELRDAGGWVDTGDLVRREGDRFYFLGRANGCINVGGRKVFPEEVEQCIRAVEGVLEVAARGRRNPFTGQVVEALVVPVAEMDGLRERIEVHCAKHLEEYKRPLVIRFVDGLEMTAAGKISRQ